MYVESGFVTLAAGAYRAALRLESMAAGSWMTRARKAAPPAAAVRRAVQVLIAALPIVVLAGFASGPSAAVWTALGLVMGAIARTFLDLGRAAAVVAAATAVAAAAAACTGRPVLAGCIVAAAAVLAGLANRWAAGVASLAPVTAAIAGSQRGLGWPALGGWILAGALYGIIVVGLVHVHLPPRPVGAARAAGHTAVLAPLCGAAEGLAVALRLPHGYWIVLTLAAVLRPVARESAGRAVKRVAGTLLGVLLPIPLVLFLPRAALITIAVACVVGSVSYLFAGQYTRQTVLMTIAIVILASGGVRAAALAVGELRLAWTIVGAAVAATAAGIMWRIERDWPA
ncbi:MAG: FUSC family protein [Streptosporangiaceae bacterium]